MSRGPELKAAQEGVKERVDRRGACALLALTFRRGQRCRGGQGEPGGGEVGTDPGIMPGAVVDAAAAGALAGLLAAAGFAAVRGFAAGFFFAAAGGIGRGSSDATTGFGLNCVVETASGLLRGSPGISNLTGTTSGL